MKVQGARRPPRECGDLPFVIKRDGTWLYRGSPIGRRELVCLFSSVLKREADGSYWLQTPAERGRIQVEDVPWMAVEMDWCGDDRGQVLSFRTNVDQVVCAGPEHPIRVRTDIATQEPTPYILVRAEPGKPPLEARISRAVYYELVALAVPGTVCGRQVLGVWSQHRFFSLGELPECCAEADGAPEGDQHDDWHDDRHDDWHAADDEAHADHLACAGPGHEGLLRSGS